MALMNLFSGQQWRNRHRKGGEEGERKMYGQSNIEIYNLVQFSSVAQSCPTLCNPMKRSMPGLPVHHQLPEFTQTHVH